MEIHSFTQHVPFASWPRGEAGGSLRPEAQSVTAGQTDETRVEQARVEQASGSEAQMDPAERRDSVGRAEKSASDPAAPKDVNGEPLSEEDLRLLEQLKQRDAEVRAHEQAHVAAGGAYITSGPSYSYQTGPDGRRYAIGGEVGIDTSMNPNDPEGNLAKARAIIRAAMAPAEPSAQDVRVAAAARAMEMRAQQEIRERQLRVYEAAMAAGSERAQIKPVKDEGPPPLSGGQERLAAYSSSGYRAIDQFA